MPRVVHPGMLAIVLSVGLVVHEAEGADPTTADCLGANETWIKLRHEHRLREARAQLLLCATESCPADVRAECARHIADVNTAIPTIVFEAKDASGNDVAGLRITVDGEPLAERAGGIAISLDPGEHAFTFEVPGEAAVQKTIVLHEGEKDRRERVVFGPAGTQSAPFQHGDTESQSTSSWSGQKTAAVVLGGMAVAGLGVGTIFGLSASSAWSNSKSECASPSNCAQHDAAVSDHDRATTAGMISTIGFGAGLAALAGGALLWFTAPSAPTKANSGGRFGVGPMTGSGAKGVQLQGNF